MGALTEMMALKLHVGHEARAFLITGILGGFTTFSAFALEAVSMLERRSYGAFAGYVSASVVFSIGALMLGLLIARRVFS